MVSYIFTVLIHVGKIFASFQFNGFKFNAFTQYRAIRITITLQQNDSKYFFTFTYQIIQIKKNDCPRKDF